MSKRMKERQEATSGYFKPISQYDFILSLGNEDWRLVAYRECSSICQLLRVFCGMQWCSIVVVPLGPVPSSCIISGGRLKIEQTLWTQPSNKHRYLMFFS